MAYPKPTSESIAIVGSGCRYPGTANTPSKLWNLLKEPHDLSRKAPSSRYNVDGFYHENGEYHGTTNAPKAYFFDEDPRYFDGMSFLKHIIATHSNEFVINSDPICGFNIPPCYEK